MKPGVGCYCMRCPSERTPEVASFENNRRHHRGAAEYNCSQTLRYDNARAARMKTVSVARTSEVSFQARWPQGNGPQNGDQKWTVHGVILAKLRERQLPSVTGCARRGLCCRSLCWRSR